MVRENLPAITGRGANTSQGRAVLSLPESLQLKGSWNNTWETAAVFGSICLEQNVKWSPLTSPEEAMPRGVGTPCGRRGVSGRSGGAGAQAGPAFLGGSHTLGPPLLYLDRNLWRWSDIFCFQSRKSDLCEQSPEALHTWRSQQEGEVKLYRKTMGGRPGARSALQKASSKGYVCVPAPSLQGRAPGGTKIPKGTEVLIPSLEVTEAHPFTVVTVIRQRGHSSNTPPGSTTPALELGPTRLRCKAGSDRESGQNSRLGFNSLPSMLRRRETQ